MTLLEVRPVTGRRVLVAEKTANISGDVRFLVTDRAPCRPTTYVARIGRTRRSLPGWTPERQIR